MSVFQSRSVAIITTVIQITDCFEVPNIVEQHHDTNLIETKGVDAYLREGYVFFQPVTNETRVRVVQNANEERHTTKLHAARVAPCRSNSSPHQRRSPRSLPLRAQSSAEARQPAPHLFLRYSTYIFRQKLIESNIPFEWNERQNAPVPIFLSSVCGVLCNACPKPVVFKLGMREDSVDFQNCGKSVSVNSARARRSQCAYFACHTNGGAN